MISANAAWRAGSCDKAEVNCPEGDNYLDWWRSFGETEGAAGALLARGVTRILAGAHAGWEQTCRIPGAGIKLRVSVRRIERQAPARFLVTHNLVAPTADEDVEDRVLSAQIQERKRLAADLHDSVGQNLVCLGLGIARLRRAAPLDPETAAIVGDMSQSLQEAHAQIRTLSFLLHPPWEDAPGAFEQAVRDLVTGFARRAGLQAAIAVSGQARALTQSRELTLFRILQEALVNIHRHAQAEAVEVALAFGERNVVLKVRDDGRGIPAPEGAAPAPGVGILGMRSRLQKFGGDLRIISSQDGTTVVAKLPT